jgi:hypothetical protein
VCEFRSGLIPATSQWEPPVFQGASERGVISFGYFSLDKQRKVTRQQGGTKNIRSGKQFRNYYKKTGKKRKIIANQGPSP